MTAPLRLAAFGLAAVLALGGGAAVGAAAGPPPAPPPVTHTEHAERPMSTTTLAPTHTHTDGKDR